MRGKHIKKQLIINLKNGGYYGTSPNFNARSIFESD